MVPRLAQAATGTIAKGNVAVLTGAASGVGLAFAQTLVKHGMRVVMADRDEASLTKATESNELKGQDVLAVPTDVSQYSQVERLRDEAIKKYGKIDLLLLNAGVSKPSASYGGDLSAWESILSTNLYGVIYGMSAIVPTMLKNREGRGAVIVTGSKQGNPAYNVSKAGVKAAAEGLAHQLRNDGDKMSAHLLIPGYTWTGLTSKAGAEKPDEAWTPQQVVDYALEKMDKEQFYIICPDGSVTEELDNARMEWSLGDLIHKRPALSRWHPDHKHSFEQHIKWKTEQLDKSQKQA